MKFLTCLVSLLLINPFSAIAIEKPENRNILPVDPDFVCIDDDGNPITCPKGEPCYSTDVFGRTIEIQCPEICFRKVNEMTYEVDCK